MECLLSFIKEWGALLLSSLGISGGFCAYLRHDRKIKEQELRQHKDLWFIQKGNGIQNKTIDNKY